MFCCDSFSFSPSGTVTTVEAIGVIVSLSWIMSVVSVVLLAVSSVGITVATDSKLRSIESACA